MQYKIIKKMSIKSKHGCYLFPLFEVRKYKLDIKVKIWWQFLQI